jgi:hypothetical protein
MKDKCVICYEESLYDKEEHIDFRIGYVEGVGQLCLDCYEDIWKPSIAGNKYGYSCYPEWERQLKEMKKKEKENKK